MTAHSVIRTLADIKAIERRPWKEHCPFDSTYDALKHAAEKFANQDAMIFLLQGNANEQPHAITHREFFQRVNQAANLFHTLGVGPNDVVSYILPNYPETHEIIWGAEASGIVNAINCFLEPATIKSLLKAANTKVLVTTTPLPNLDLWEPVIAIADELKSVETILVVDPSHYQNLPLVDLPPKTPKGKRILHYQQNRDQQKSDLLASGRTISPTETASLFHTGGTTGTPKLAPHTHENEVFTAWALSKLIPTDPGQKALVGLPLFHVNAVIATGLSSFMSGVVPIILSPMGYRGKDVIENIWKIVERYRASLISGVPTIYSALMSVPIEQTDINSLRFAAVGAAPISPELFKNFQDYTGVELLEAYGLTETTVTAACNPCGGEKRIGSVGLRLPFQETRCAHLNDGGEIERFCGINEVGTVVVRGPNVFPGYYKTDQQGLTSAGWLNTGDLGRLDKDGYLWLTGRSKDLIIRGGHNIDPAMIEQSLEQHNAVALAAAVGQPDEYAGELPAAFVQLQPGTQISATELKRWAKDNIAERAASPVHVEILDSLPVTAVGKIHKPPLKEMATQRVLREKIATENINANLHVINDTKRGMVVKVETEEQERVVAALGKFAIAIDVDSIK